MIEEEKPWIKTSKKEYDSVLNQHKGEVRHSETRAVISPDGSKSELTIWYFSGGEYPVIRSDSIDGEFNYYLQPKFVS